MRLDDCTSAVPLRASIGAVIRHVATCHEETWLVFRTDSAVGGYDQKVTCMSVSPTSMRFVNFTILHDND